MDKRLVGKVSHYFDRIGVAIIDLEEPLKVGDKISIEKGENVIEQKVESIQINHQAIEKAQSGDSIGLKTIEPVKKGSKVFIITE